MPFTSDPYEAVLDELKGLPTGDWAAHLRALSASALAAADLLDSLGDVR